MAERGGEGTPEERRALFRVVRGTPDDAELAALTAVVAAAAAAGDGEQAAPPVRDRWSDPAVRLRTQLTPGAGAWRTAFGPR